MREQEVEIDEVLKAIGDAYANAVEIMTFVVIVASTLIVSWPQIVGWARAHCVPI